MHKANNRYYLDCSICGNEYEVGKNTYFNKKVKPICLYCRVKINNENEKLVSKMMDIYTCESCEREFAMSSQSFYERKLKYGKILCMSCSKKGNLNPFYDHHFDKKQLNKLSKARYDYYNDLEFGEQRRLDVSNRTSGKNNPMYKGTELKSDYTYRNKCFRQKVLKRDNYTCVKCLNKFNTNELKAHHKNSCDWDIDGRLDINNGVTLCDKCHKLFHNIYGYGSNTERQFNEFIQKGSETIEDVNLTLVE